LIWTFSEAARRWSSVALLEESFAFKSPPPPPPEGAEEEEEEEGALFWLPSVRLTSLATPPALPTALALSAVAAQRQMAAVALTSSCRPVSLLLPA
jgi:hypothetical protein